MLELARALSLAITAEGNVLKGIGRNIAMATSMLAAIGDVRRF
tara:strand:+ start:220 stop:348 length:129 start_codon:yes stop_codon:yes gene_type:complete